MDVFKEYNHIFLTTVLLISNFSTFAVAVCTLPTELHNSVWNYQYTDLSNNAQTTTLTFGRTTLAEPSNIRLNALGTILNAWTCISNLTLSSTVSVAVFKSDESYSDFNANTTWVYICMKLTKVADDLFYFYLLSDEDSSVYPKESISIKQIRTLKKSGSSTTLPSDVSLCEPCDSSCEGATTETTSLKTTQNTTLPSTSSEIDITLNITSTETTQKTTTQSNSTEMMTATEFTLLETTQKTTAQSTSTEMVASTEMTPLETTQRTTAQSTSTEMVTSTEMTPLETTQKITSQSPSTDMIISTEMNSLEKTQKTTAQSSMGTTTEKKSTQNTPLPSTSTNLVTTIQQTTVHIMVGVTETNGDINVVNTDVEDKTTMDTQSTV
ncbi:unnamed protein product [Mytilus edulis]|uniref:Uncharacterized protein n=1 Tax=Mytilus edulis TaxID=6550 RepID=A0A8S3UAU1_MYTED|nr:unnamed protein product [Mytilus edulis]